MKKKEYTAEEVAEIYSSDEEGESELFTLEELEDMPCKASLEIDGNRIDFPVLPKQYKSGTIGYWTQERLKIDADNKFLIQVQIFLIGSKNS